MNCKAYLNTLFFPLCMFAIFYWFYTYRVTFDTDAKDKDPGIFLASHHAPTYLSRATSKVTSWVTLLECSLICLTSNLASNCFSPFFPHFQGPDAKGLSQQKWTSLKAADGLFKKQRTPATRVRRPRLAGVGPWNLLMLEQNGEAEYQKGLGQICFQMQT